ncbi:MAG: putative GTPase [Pseudomonadota bacterium]
MVIIDADLSPIQERNIEKFLQCRVLDRQGLILDIFARRASSHIGKLQVELAQLQYLSTRLVRGWSHLERQKGGIGLRGPGETQLETDRRLIGNRIKQLSKKLDKQHNQKDLNRYKRKKGNKKIIALMGYTNAGKTTLFNALTNQNQYSANQLFATLDSKTSKASKDLGSGEILISDTVGFISNIPTNLIESFKATLDDLRNADLLLHVVDANDPEKAEKIFQTQSIIKELSIEIPQLLVFNKSDLLQKTDFVRIDDEHSVYISSTTKLGFENLKLKINSALYGTMYNGWIKIPYKYSFIRYKLEELGIISEEKNLKDSLKMHISIHEDHLLPLINKDYVQRA